MAVNFDRLRENSRRRREGDAAPAIINSQLPRPGAEPSREDQQRAARNLVTAPDRGEVRDTSADRRALQSPGIAGLSGDAVQQRSGRFAQVSAAGFQVPNLASRTTRKAFDRFFGAKTQEQRDADPTRASFQNRFFSSETLKDVGIG